MTRIGLIGCGKWGRNAARAMSRAGVLAWVSDPDTDAAVALASEHGVPVRPPYDFTGCDGCWVASPIETHELLVRELIVAHKHVLCEKPLARTKAQAEMLADEAKRRGLVLMADHTWLGHAGVVDVMNVTGDLRTYSAYRHANDVRGFDPLEDLLPHDVAILRLRMKRDGWRVRVASNRPESALVAIDDGTTYTMLSYSYDAAEKLRTIHARGDEYRSNDGTLPTGAPEPLSVILAAFTEAIRTGEQPRIGNADEFVHVAAVIEAAKKSRASGGGWVDVV